VVEHPLSSNQNQKWSLECIYHVKYPFQSLSPFSHQITISSYPTNKHTSNQSNRQKMTWNKVEDEISIELINKNHKSDQIITHHKIGEMKSEIKWKKFWSNHHKIPKHDYLIKMRWKLWAFIIKFISNLSILQNLSHNPPTIFQDQNDHFLLQYLLLFYPTIMKREMKELEIDLTSFLKNGSALASINTFATSFLLWYDATIRGVYPF